MTKLAVCPSNNRRYYADTGILQHCRKMATHESENLNRVITKGSYRNNKQLRAILSPCNQVFTDNLNSGKGYKKLYLEQLIRSEKRKEIIETRHCNFGEKPPKTNI